MMTSMILTHAGLGLVNFPPNYIEGSPGSRFINLFIYSPLPWICLIFGLGLAYLILGRRYVARLRELRKTNAMLANRLNEVIDDQNLMLDSLSDDFAMEKEKWSLQVTNRDNLITGLNSRISRSEEDRKAEMALRTSQLTALQSEFHSKKESEESLVKHLELKEREIGGLKRDLSSEGALGKRVRELEGILGQRDQQIKNMTFERKTANAAHVEKIREWQTLLTDKVKANQELEVKVDNLQRKLDQRIDELETVLSERDRKLKYEGENRLQLENRINELERELGEKDIAIYALEIDLSEKEENDLRLVEFDKLLENRSLEVNQLRGDRENLKMNLETRIREQDTRIDELEKVGASRATQISALKTEVKACRGFGDRVDELEELLGNRERELEHSKNDRYELENRINELELATSEKDNTIFALETDLTEKQGARQLLDEVDVILEKHDNELNHLREERERVKAGLGATIEDLNRQLGEKDTEIVWIHEAKNAREKEISALKIELKARQALDRRIDELEEQLGDRDRKLDHQKNERFELENRINELEFDINEKANAIYVLETDLTEKQGARQRVEELDTILEHRDLELNKLREQRETIKAELGARIQKLEQQLSEKEERIDEPGDREIQLLKSEPSHSQQDRDRIGELEHLLRERDSELDDLKDGIGDQNDLFKDLQDTQWILGERDEELRVANSENDHLTDRIDELESILGERDRQLEGVHFEKKGLAFQLREQDSELKSVRRDLDAKSGHEARISELEWLLGERDAALHHLHSEKDGLAGSRGDLEARIGELEWLLGERDGELRNLRYEREHIDGSHEGLKARISELEWLLGERDGELQHLRSEKDTPTESHSDHDDRIRELEWLLGERDSELQTLRSEKDDLTGSRSDLEARVSELEWILGERDAEVEDLKGGRYEIERQLKGREREIVTLRSHMEEASRKDEIITDLDRKLGDLNSLLHSQQEEINSLHSERAERQGLKTRINEQDKELKNLRNELSARESNTATLGLFASDNTDTDSRLGAVYPTRPDQVDDLKKINGIAAVLESKLNEIGVYRYKQIAVWTGEQIDEFGERLVFRDRILRDQWIPQALDLHRREYGESLPPRIDLYQKPAPSSKHEGKHSEPQSEEPVVITSDSAFENEPVKLDRLLGPVFSSRPRDVDDLTQINGLTDQISVRLNNFGIYRYKQIAYWGGRHLKEFRMLLNINGNTDLRHWINEAVILHREKYGEQIT